MTPADAEEYTQALGQVVAGGWRQIALGQRLGVPQALKLTVDAWVKQRLGGYVKLSLAEVKTAADELKADGYSNRDVAKVLGVGETQVRRALTDAPNGAPTRTDTKKPSADAPNGAPVDVPTALASALAAPDKLAVHHSSASSEHYTPRVILDATLAVLGAIDLDPCSDGATVPAGQHYTITDDGLAQAWFGRVYMNPPYGDAIDVWVAKLCAEYAAGRVTAAIALVPARPDTQWTRRLRDYYKCELTGRLTFGGNQDPAPFPSVVFYLGDDLASFARGFRTLGDLWRRLEV